MASILKENAKVLSTFMAADMDNRFGPNLMDAEISSAVSATSGQSPTRKRAHVASSSCLSV